MAGELSQNEKIAICKNDPVLLIPFQAPKNEIPDCYHGFEMESWLHWDVSWPDNPHYFKESSLVWLRTLKKEPFVRFEAKQSPFPGRWKFLRSSADMNGRETLSLLTFTWPQRLKAPNFVSQWFRRDVFEFRCSKVALEDVSLIQSAWEFRVSLKSHLMRNHPPNTS